MGWFVLSPQTRVGFVALQVHDLARMRDWYHQVVGLTVLQDNGVRALLGVAGNRHVLLSLTRGGTVVKRTRAGLAAFSFSVPNWQVLLAVAAQLTRAGAEPLAWHQTGFAQGFSAQDPEFNVLLVEYDRGTQVEVTRGYDFTDGAMRPLKPPARLAQPAGALTVGTQIGRFVVRTTAVTQTAWYLRAVLGFVRQQEDDSQAFLTNGDAVRHIGWSVIEDLKAKPRFARHTGVQYVNLTVPNQLALTRLYANLLEVGWHDFHFDPAAHYLMVTGPNQLTLWFSIR
ncbi:VOC family protein [Lacticaseibacillus absianus]|uniref:VOC family protein n=1 Tax=Lacticaseibacillus absianus TaxID=2729623 RepID=UPI0015C79A7B|nr:VOC family protein [Lacticaseibacillus absianus]